MLKAFLKDRTKMAKRICLVLNTEHTTTNNETEDIYEPDLEISFLKTTVWKTSYFPRISRKFR